MNTPLKKLSALVIIMFLTLMGAVSYIQVIKANQLNTDTRNARMLYKEFGTNRGMIIVNGKPVATSNPVKDNYKYQRVYNDSELYSHLTGYFSVAYNSMTGLERQENSILGGRDATLAKQKIQELINGTTPQGGSVLLTVNPKLQQVAYDALGNYRGAVVAIEPNTGKILAMVSKPTFDANKMADHKSKEVIKYWESLLADPDKPLHNRAIGDELYAPGSVFKIVTATAMLESGLTPESEIEAPTTWKLPTSDKKITNYSGTCGNGSGKTTLRTALIESCNTPFAIAGTQLGSKKMRKVAQKFGFEKELEIPIPINPAVFPATNDPATLAMDSFGQRDVRVSPLQMAMVASAVANNGKLMQPYLVDKTLDANFETIVLQEPQIMETVMKPETANQLTSMMIDVVNKGTGRRARINGIKIAGKTGTAETGNKDEAHAWFIGFDATEQPKIAIAVFVEDGGFGSAVAAPIGKKVMMELLKQ